MTGIRRLVENEVCDVDDDCAPDDDEEIGASSSSLITLSLKGSVDQPEGVGIRKESLII